MYVGRHNRNGRDRNIQRDPINLDILEWLQVRVT